MGSINQCPITHITLHSILKEFARQEIIKSYEVYRPGFGLGSRYLYNGEPLEIRTGFVGKLDWLNVVGNQPAVFHEPHDLAYDAKTKTLVAFAKSA